MFQEGMKNQRLALVLLGGLRLATVLGGHAPGVNLYWIDPGVGGVGNYFVGAAYADGDDCPFIDDPSWVALSSMDACKERCNGMNENWNRLEDSIAPCTSIAWDEPTLECAVHSCGVYPYLAADL